MRLNILAWDNEEQELDFTCPFCGYEVENEEDEVEWSTKTKTKTTIGIDYSLTSPAVCLDNGNLMFFYLTNKKKWTGQMSEDIIGMNIKSGLTYTKIYLYFRLCV